MSAIQFSIIFAIFGTSLLISVACLIQVSKLTTQQAKLIKAIETGTHKIEEGNKNLSQVFQNVYGLHGWYVPSIKYLLIALVKYVEEMKDQAISNERYEEAKKCNSAIVEMNKLINA